MAKLKKFEFSEIENNANAIISENGIEAVNEIDGLVVQDKASGEPIGTAVASYDGLAVLTAVNPELFENTPKTAKQVITEKFLMLKVNSKLEIDGKKYKVCEVKEFDACFVALIQAA